MAVLAITCDDALSAIRAGRHAADATSTSQRRRLFGQTYRPFLLIVRRRKAANERSEWRTARSAVDRRRPQAPILLPQVCRRGPGITDPATIASALSIFQPTLNSLGPGFCPVPCVSFAVYWANGSRRARRSSQIRLRVVALRAQWQS